MSLIRYNPRRESSVWRPFFDLQSEINRLFTDSLSGTSTPVVFAPAVDVFEKDDKIVVKADLPGLNRDNLQVTVHEGVLTLRGSREEREEVKEENYTYVERTTGTFQRSIALPADVQTDKVSATYKDGVLTIEAPKAPSAVPRTVEVKVS
jgi:HSP20 family protein